MRSTRIHRPKGSVLFETGPHTLPFGEGSSLPSFEIIEQLKLEDRVLFLEPDTTTRAYIKYQGRLVPFVAEFSLKWITEPLLRGGLGGLFKFAFSDVRRPAGLEDESITSWWTRRFSEKIAKVWISAFIHGIYAGDAERLSMRSTLFKVFWEAESQGKKRPMERPEIKAVRDEIKAGLKTELYAMKPAQRPRSYTFRDGLEELPSTLRQTLKGLVEINTDSPVQSIQAPSEANKDIRLRTPLRTHHFSHIVSTIPLPKLFQVLPSPPADLVGSFPPSATVAVVNLYYAEGSASGPTGAFGYLIPKTETWEIENPEAALGVIFISKALSSQDTGEFAQGGFKLSVLMGGEYWRGRSSFPSEDELLAAAKSVVERDLGITAEPTINQVSLQRECIPQYEVGHWQRVERLEDYLNSTFGQERLKVIGSPVSGVSINECILAGRQTASRLNELS